VETEDLRQDFYLYPRPRKKGADVWYVKFRDPKTREILPGRSSGKTNQRRAEDWARSEYARLSKESKRPPLTMREWSASFWSADCAYVRRKINDDGHYAEKTRKQNRRFLERFIRTDDELMDLRLSDFSKDEVLAFRDRLIEDRFEGKACRTVQLVMSALRTMINFARDGGHLDGNPFFRVKLGAYTQAERVALSEKELDLVLERVRYENGVYWMATMVAAATGMRAGEVRGLRAGDLRPKAVPVGLIFIERQLLQASSKDALPKWGKKRTCPYPLSLQEILEPERKKLKDDDFLFASARGEGHLPNMGYHRWSDAFIAAAKSAGVEATLHSLRHTLNTILIQRGIPEGVIRAALGWSDPKIQASYTHIDTFGATYRSKMIDSVVEAIQGKPKRGTSGVPVAGHNGGMMNAKLKNLMTGEVIEVHSTTNHPASSYGIEVWVTPDGEAIGQVGMPLLGFEFEEAPSRA